MKVIELLSEAFKDIDPKKFKGWSVKSRLKDLQWEENADEEERTRTKNYPPAIMKAIELIETNYSNAWAQYSSSNNARRIYRGFDSASKYSHLAYKEVSGKFTRRPRGGFRISSLFPEFLPSWKGYPSRIKNCQIGGTDIRNISDIISHDSFYWLLPHNKVKTIAYLPNADWNINPGSLDHNTLWAMIPPDLQYGVFRCLNCLIVNKQYVGLSDLGSSSTATKRMKDRIIRFDTELQKALENDRDMSVLDFIDKKLELIGLDADEILSERRLVAKLIEKKGYNSLMEMLDVVFSPKINNIRTVSSSSINQIPSGVECWFNGEALAIHVSAAKTIMRIMQKRKKK